ncbi:MAG: hypothetical protein OXG18_00720, partial [Gemmatimonadetes bacterium]|nr:hypothetical protein [Gemmatimonadota bacterium]
RLSRAIERLADGGFALARSRIPKMLAEERSHERVGAGWFGRLADAGGDAASRVEEAVRSMLPSTLAWLLPDDEPYDELVDGGFAWPSGRVRTLATDRLGTLLARAGVVLEEVAPDRAGWDAERRRGVGAPGEEAVERARGDRNRDLFVE